MSRKDYWLKSLGASIAVGILGVILTSIADFFIVVAIIGYIAVGIVTLFWARLRFHDVGLSGAWLFLGLVPAVGNIATFIILVLPANTFNSYGNTAKQKVETK